MSASPKWVKWVQEQPMLRSQGLGLSMGAGTFFVSEMIVSGRLVLTTVHTTLQTRDYRATLPFCETLALSVQIKTTLVIR